MPLISYSNCSAATMASDRNGYGFIRDATILVEGGKIAWAGLRGEEPVELDVAASFDLDGATVTPALIDCHTHIVFGGNRAWEFEQRLQGASYADIARAGGGIVSTMRDTRAASEDGLVRSALPRLDALLSEGVSTVEVKSGYGLTIEDELKSLRAARRLGELRPVKIVTSWLAAHAVPPEYSGRPDDYIDEVAIRGLELAHEEGLVDAVDGFCETIAFSPSQIRRLFEVATELNLPTKLHAEQLSGLGGARLAAEFGALSADHLEYLDEAGVEAMADSGTVAVLLPGAFYTLRETRKPPISLLRDANVPIAIATDANPGSSPLHSPLLAMNLACNLFSLTPEEALRGITASAAAALGMQDLRGTIEPGKVADLAVWEAPHPRELSYWIGLKRLKSRIVGGKLC